MNEATIRQAEQQLIKLDPLLGKLIAKQSLKPRSLRSDYFASLCRSIVGQQVSVAAATAIFARLEQATALQPLRLVTLDETTIKTIGLSKQKAGYIKDLAQHFADNPDVYNHLEAQSDEQVITELIAIKGIGTWTAQMFLMFTLGRPDVFAPDDVGLQRAMMRLYKWDDLPPKKELEKWANNWRPYRTVASFHLWQSLDNAPT
jgi:DNA-3-methyladenine glycosylase II